MMWQRDGSGLRKSGKRARRHTNAYLLPNVLESLERRDLLAGDLIITGVIDGPLAGGTPKAIELYATADINDLSVYAIGSANNGGGTDGPELVLSGAATAGQFLYVASETDNFASFFGFPADFQSTSASINGDDAIELFLDGNADGFADPLASDDVVMDVFGDIDVDGTGEPWEYLDGWAYRESNTVATSVFAESDWTFSGPNALDGETTNATASVPFPAGSYVATTETTEPELAVRQMDAGRKIQNGDLASASAGTDFGSHEQGGDAITKRFEISNTGIAELELTGSTVIALNGSADFSIVAQPSANTIPGGDAISFDIQFLPTTAGEQSAEITIASNDTDEASFSFQIVGFVTVGAEPEIQLLGKEMAISSGDTTPEPADGTDFGKLLLNSRRSQSFVIDNTAGTADLAIQGIDILGENAASFTVADVPVSVAAGEQEPFNVVFSPTSAGIQTATVAISSSDADESDYRFTVQGEGFSVADSVTINEVDADIAGDEDAEFVELYDGGVGNTSLDGLVLALFNGNGGVAYDAYDLSGFSTDADGFFVFGDANVPSVDYVPANFTSGSNIQNGEDAVALFAGVAADFSDGTSAAEITAPLIDAVVYETGSDTDSTLPTDLSTGEVIDENANGNGAQESIARVPDGAGEWHAAIPTPGSSNRLPVLEPAIVVLGDEQAISAGDTTPSTADGTDFGAFVIGTGPLLQTFEIQNAGPGELSLTDISVTGSSDFQLVGPSASLVASGESLAFSIQFNALTSGAQEATVTIASNDPDESNFTFTVRASAANAPAAQLSILGNGQNLPDGANATLDLGTDFGSVRTAEGTASQTFVILNPGSAQLRIDTVELRGAHSDDFEIVATPASIEPGEQAELAINFDPAEDGIRTALVTINSNDPDQPSFSFSIQGTGVTIATDVVINEIDVDMDGDEDQEFVELYDGGVGSTSLDGLVLILFNGNGSTSYQAFDLDGLHTNDQGYFVLGDANVPNVEFTPPSFSPSSNLQNGEDAVALYIGNAAEFPNGTTATAEHLLDAVVYETGNDTDSDLPTLLQVTAVANEDANGMDGVQSLSRLPNGEGIFVATTPSPGTANVRELRDPEIHVAGQGVPIANGDDSPEANDGTMFGTLVQGQGFQRQAFAISNSGDGELTITSATIQGAVDFEIEFEPVVLGPGEVTELAVIFRPQIVGSRFAIVTIRSDDSLTPEYRFDVSGTVEAPAERQVAMEGNGVDIEPGDETPDLDDGTDFGQQEVGTTGPSQSFTIRNDGDTVLLVGLLSASGPAASDFVIDTMNAPTFVAAGATSSFDVHFAPSAVGLREAIISIPNSDASQPNFTFAVQGVATQPPQFPDFDSSGVVDFADFLILSGNFGKTDLAFENGDTNGDHTVNFADFLELSRQFGRRR